MNYAKLHPSTLAALAQRKQDVWLEQIRSQLTDAFQARDEAVERGDDLCIKVIDAWLKELYAYEAIASR